MITTPKMLGLLAVAFVAGSFVASPELRAYAAATIGSAEIIDNSIQSVDIKDAEVKSADLAGNAVTAAKIKDGEVKAAEIAADAVGASELQGVTKLIFAHCKLTTGEATFVYVPSDLDGIDCSITGVDSSDTVVATLDNANHCFHVEGAVAEIDNVQVTVRNGCSTSQTIGSGSFIGIIVFDK